MRRALTLITFMCILACCGCASLFHKGPYAELTGQKIEDQNKTTTDTKADNSAEVTDGTSVQATASVQGDGFWMAVKDTAPKLAYALAAVLIVHASKRASFRANFEMNSARSRGNSNE